MQDVLAFVKSIDLDPKSTIEQKRKILFEGYLLFCKDRRDCASTFKLYRAACRGALGFDLPQQKPILSFESVVDPVGLFS